MQMHVVPLVGQFCGAKRPHCDVERPGDDAIQRLVVLMRYELEKDNVDGFAQLLTEHWQESQHIDAGSTNTCIDQIFTVIDDLVDGKMICGAGGGGFLQVVLKKGVTRDDLRERLNEVFQDSGVDVWECAFV